ncbi:MAG: hypothetical protein P8175_08200 [Deltaproteobacteria bacterium]
MGDLIPIHYKIHLEPDLERFRFEGEVEIVLMADEPVGEICLNAVDLAVWKCELMADPEREMCAFTVERKRESLRVMLPGERTGRISLVIRYTGKINSKMAGFYSPWWRSRIHRSRRKEHSMKEG